MGNVYYSSFVAGILAVGLVGCDGQGGTGVETPGNSSEQAVSSLETSDATRAALSASEWKTKRKGSLFTTNATSEDGAIKASFSMRFAKQGAGLELSTPGGGKVALGVNTEAGNQLTQQVATPVPGQDVTTLKFYAADAKQMEVPYGCYGSAVAAAVACAFAASELFLNYWANAACAAAIIAEYEDCGVFGDDGGGSSGGWTA